MRVLPRVIAAVAVILLLQFGSAVGAARAAEQATEYEIKAAFLYNFATYIIWPDEELSVPADSPMIFGVLEADEMAVNLKVIGQERDVNGRPVEVRRIRPGDSINTIHVLFVGREATEYAEPLLFEALENSVLTVTESRESRPSASVINFELIDDRVRFDVSLSAADRANLVVSSRLLQVALQVIGQNL